MHRTTLPPSIPDIAMQNKEALTFPFSATLILSLTLNHASLQISHLPFSLV